MNIGEVARRAGVSRSTVSYVLSGKRQVTDRTRQRVLQVIDEVGYRPSAVARALAHGETRTLGLVIPPLRHHLSLEQLQFVGAIADAAANHDYDILLSPSGDDRERAFQKLVAERRVDGIILMETGQHDDRARELAARRFPFVTIGRTGYDDHAWVDLDYSGLVGQAARRLHQLGHRHVALINRSSELLDRGYGPAVRALEAFTSARAELGLTGPAICCDDLPSAARHCVSRLFAADSQVTAILTINEQALSGILFALRDLGLRVPDEVSLLAVAADRVATTVYPEVSAADVPAEEMGTHAVETLMRLIANPQGPLARILLSPPFTDRGTLAPAPLAGQASAGTGAGLALPAAG